MIWELFGMVAEGAITAGVDMAHDAANARQKRVHSALRVVDGTVSGFYKQDWRSGDVEVSTAAIRLDELSLNVDAMSSERSRRTGFFEEIPSLGAVRMSGVVFLVRVGTATLEWVLPGDIALQARAWLEGGDAEPPGIN